MSKRTRTQVIVIVAGAAFMGWRALGLAEKYSPTPVLAQAGVPVEPDDVAAGQGESVVQETHEFPAAIELAQAAVAKKPWGRDPFDPTPFVTMPTPSSTATEVKAPVNAPPAPTVKFTGVSKKGTRWLAAVDGAIIGVGDVVQDKYRVVGITNSSLTLVAEGWAFRYDLGEKTGQVRPWTENL